METHKRSSLAVNSRWSTAIQVEKDEYKNVEGHNKGVMKRMEDKPRECDNEVHALVKQEFIKQGAILGLGN